MKNYLLPAVLFPVLFFSCKKDTFSDTTAPELVIGNYTGMVVKNHDHTLTSSYNKPPVYYNLDVNDDGVDDIRFTAHMWGSPGLGVYYEAAVNCLNPAIQLCGSVKIDSSFTNTTISSYTDANGNLMIDSTIYVSCKRMSAVDAITGIYPDRFKMMLKDKNMILKKQDFFKNDSVLLLIPNGFILQILHPLPTTTVNFRNIYYNDCDDLEMAVVKFIGFKFTLNKETKIGWIKIIGIDPNTFLILESAIQK